MKKFTIVLLECKSLIRLKLASVEAKTVESARQMAYEIFKPKNNQFVGAEVS